MSTPSPPNPSQRPTPLEKADSGHERMEEARMWNVVSYLISGPVMLGGVGWGLDLWLGTEWLVAVGIVAGMTLSLYLVWFRYGTQ